jgi:arylsulfatase A-like enzyme
VRRFISLLVLLALASGSRLTAADKPNVIFVLADDQRFDTIAALGNGEIKTPNLDKLVARGFTFTNAYCQGSMVPAVCAPSRTMILTGRSLFRIPSPQAKTYDGPTLPGVFGAAGYATLHVGKPGNSFRAAHQKFDKNVEIAHQNAPTAQKCADAVIDFVKAHDGKKPFFVYLAPAVPHDPRVAPAEFHKLYDPAKLTLSKNFMKRHPFDNGELEVRDERLAPVPRTEADMRKHLADYYATITNLDHELGRVLDAVKSAGHADNTLVVFTSDQGLAVGGRHGLMGKQNLYEHFKSPLVIAGPGVPKGKSDALVYLFDLFPTLCDLAGVAVPKGVEGESLAPVMTGKQTGRKRLFAAYKDVQRMVRDRTCKLIWYPKVEKFQLFDLSTDPDELKDLSEDEAYAKQFAELRAAMAREQKAWGDPAPLLK